MDKKDGGVERRLSHIRATHRGSALTPSDVDCPDTRNHAVFKLLRISIYTRTTDSRWSPGGLHVETILPGGRVLPKPMKPAAVDLPAKARCTILVLRRRKMMLFQ